MLTVLSSYVEKVNTAVVLTNLSHFHISPSFFKHSDDFQVPTFHRNHHRCHSIFLTRIQLNFLPSILMKKIFDNMRKSLFCSDMQRISLFQIRLITAATVLNLLQHLQMAIIY